MTTVQQVFDIAMSLIDERLESGTVNPSSTAIFKKNTPYILTTLQDELIPLSDNTKTYLIMKGDITSNVDGYASYEMPEDFYNIYKLIQIKSNGGNYEEAYDYKWEGNRTLLIPNEFVGMYKVLYRPIPLIVESLTDNLMLDDITCRTTLANGLASRLLTNENQKLSNYFGEIYNELKNAPKQRKVMNTTKIIDKVGTKLNY